MTDPNNFWDKWANRTRFVLFAAIAVLAALILAGPQNHGIPNPFELSRAQAEGVAAAPGYLVLTAQDNTTSKFCLIDTTKKVICMYNLNGAKLRLVAVRKFDVDSDILDSSIDVKTVDGKGVIKSFEGGNGIDRKTAREYGKGLLKMIEDGVKK